MPKGKQEQRNIFQKISSSLQIQTTSMRAGSDVNHKEMKGCEE